MQSTPAQSDLEVARARAVNFAENATTTFGENIFFDWVDFNEVQKIMISRPFSFFLQANWESDPNQSATAATSGTQTLSSPWKYSALINLIILVSIPFVPGS